MVSSDSDDDASAESQSDNSRQPLEMETKDTSPAERDEMPRWLRYLPNYERVVNHKTTGLTYPPTDTHSGTPARSSRALPKSSRAIACSSGATKASNLKAKFCSAVSFCGVDNQPGECGLHAHITSVRGKRSFTSIDQPVEEVVAGEDKIPTLWPENDMPEAVDRVSYAAEGVNNNIVGATGRKRRKTGTKTSTTSVSVTEISALLSFSKC